LYYVSTTAFGNKAGAKTRESQEVLFVDRVQHFDSGALDDLIFQCGNAERAKLTRFTHFLDNKLYAQALPCKLLAGVYGKGPATAAQRGGRPRGSPPSAKMPTRVQTLEKWAHALS